MRTQLIISALLGALLFSTPVLAGQMNGRGITSRPWEQTAAQANESHQCRALERQYGSVVMGRGNAAQSGEVRTLGTKGRYLCHQGREAAGAAKLEQALKDLDMTHIEG
jgi:hypothetical protein